MGLNRLYEKKKGRNSKRDTNRNENILMRVTSEEKKLIKELNQDLKPRLKLTDFLIYCVFQTALSRSFKTPVERIKELELSKF